MKNDRRIARLLPLAAILAAFLPACNNPQSTRTPARISIVSGDGQVSKKGTVLDQPLRVLVRFASGSPSKNVTVRFAIRSGGGHLSRTSDVTDIDGIACTRLTLPNTTGAIQVSATAANIPNLTVTFRATSGDYFCPEENPTFVRRFTPQGNIMLFTRFSGLLKSGGELTAGILRIVPDFSAQNPSVVVSAFATFPEQTFRITTSDCAFSRNGQFYIAAGEYDDEVIRVDNAGQRNHLSLLDDPFGYEITSTPGAILMGCDSFGPFAVGCRDTLTRFPGAQFTGTGSDACNDDACAVDPNTGDLYFIYLGDNTLRRVPLDTLAVTGPVTTMASLTADEASGANGMVVNDDDGSVFFVVDTGNTKQLIRVTSAGVHTVEYDFTSRGAGNLAGRQNDLAIDTRGGGVLYTLDTLNNMLLAWDITQHTLTELPPDPAVNSADALSTLTGSGEHVGIAVIP